MMPSRVSHYLREAKSKFKVRASNFRGALSFHHNKKLISSRGAARCLYLCAPFLRPQQRVRGRFSFY